MNRLNVLIRKYWSILVYLLFGVLTTLVNYLVYFPLYNWLCWSATLSNIISWVVAVIFAFLTNKPFVFKSNDWSCKTVLDEGIKFAGCRVASGAMETFFIWLLVDYFLLNGNWMKIVISFFVVVLNYISSKLIVFKK